MKKKSNKAPRQPNPDRELSSDEILPDDDRLVDPEEEALALDEEKMSKDLLNAAITLTLHQVRFLSDYYYQMQRNRIRTAHQISSMKRNSVKLHLPEEPHAMLDWLFNRNERLEFQVAAALVRFSVTSPLGVWAQSNAGIGPIIAATLMSNFDPERAPTAGHYMSFAGLNPTAKWLPKTERPWNARLKTLMWKVGQSFVKVSNDPDAYYGQHYVQRKAYEVARNLRGELAQKAAEYATRVGEKTDAWGWYSACYTPDVLRRYYALEKEIMSEESIASEEAKIKAELAKKFEGPDLEKEQKKARAAAKRALVVKVNVSRAALLKASKGEPGSGMALLPPGHLQSRATRYAAKIFLSHYHEASYVERFGKLPPAPYPIMVLGHAHQLFAPNMELIPGWVELRRAVNPTARKW